MLGIVNANRRLWIHTVAIPILPEVFFPATCDHLSSLVRRTPLHYSVSTSRGCISQSISHAYIVVKLYTHLFLISSKLPA